MSLLFSFEVSFAYLTPKVYMALLLCSFHPNKHPEGFQMKSELLLLCLHFSPLEDSCFLLTQGDVFFCNARLSSQIPPGKTHQYVCFVLLSFTNKANCYHVRQ